LGWVARQQELLRLAGCQLFFVGGAPRSGPTWLQLLLDSHPVVCCRGEGLFQKHLADPLDGSLPLPACGERAEVRGVRRYWTDTVKDA
jgi:Sulfotransferase family